MVVLVVGGLGMVVSPLAVAVAVVLVRVMVVAAVVGSMPSDMAVPMACACEADGRQFAGEVQHRLQSRGGRILCVSIGMKMRMMSKSSSSGKGQRADAVAHILVQLWATCLEQHAAVGRHRLSHVLTQQQQHGHQVTQRCPAGVACHHSAAGGHGAGVQEHGLGSVLCTWDAEIALACLHRIFERFWPACPYPRTSAAP